MSTLPWTGLLPRCAPRRQDRNTGSVEPAPRLLGAVSEDAEAPPAATRPRLLARDGGALGVAREGFDAVSEDARAETRGFAERVPGGDSRARGLLRRVAAPDGSRERLGGGGHLGLRARRLAQRAQRAACE